MNKPTKKCKSCEQERLKSAFVSRFGFENPRGQLCRDCWIKRHEDTSMNVVYCCADCNMKKKDRPFAEWMKSIPVGNLELASNVYMEKNGVFPD
jgi:hypothetical protein